MSRPASSTPHTADQVYALVGELVREHDCTTLLVSHDPESAKIADRIIRIRDGRVSEEWAPDGEASDTIVVGRGGWLRLPEELLLRAGIGERATAQLEDGRVDRLARSRISPQHRPEEPCPGSDPGHGRNGGTGGGARARARRRATARLASSTGSMRRSAAAAFTRSPARQGQARRPSSTSWPVSSSPTPARSRLPASSSPSLDRAGRAAHRRAAIAYVGQQAGLVPHLSALENVELALTLRGVDDPGGLAFSTLEAVGLAERARQRVSRLSQGERARVAIARAIAARPKLLLADEPTSRLDGANAVAVAHLLARLARETGAAVLCATHDPLVIEQADDELKLI